VIHAHSYLSELLLSDLRTLVTAVEQTLAALDQESHEEEPMRSITSEIEAQGERMSLPIPETAQISYCSFLALAAAIPCSLA
jgi:anti-sigma-K factor RskA